MVLMIKEMSHRYVVIYQTVKTANVLVLNNHIRSIFNLRIAPCILDLKKLKGFFFLVEERVASAQTCVSTDLPKERQKGFFFYESLYS